MEFFGGARVIQNPVMLVLARTYVQHSVVCEKHRALLCIIYSALCYRGKNADSVSHDCLLVSPLH